MASMNSSLILVGTILKGPWGRFSISRERHRFSNNSTFLLPTPYIPGISNAHEQQTQSISFENDSHQIPRGCRSFDRGGG